jgi:hypothetical protein
MFLDGYTRRVNVRPGFDCRNGDCPSCACGRRDNHGIGSEQRYFTVIVPEAALTLNVSTPFYPETVQASPNEYSCRGLDLCLAWPVSTGAIAGAASPGDCEYIGKCYAGDEISLLRADRFFEDRFVIAAGRQQPESFWKAMHELLLASMDAAAPARRLRQCACCKGEGVTEQ